MRREDLRSLAGHAQRYGESKDYRKGPPAIDVAHALGKVRDVTTSLIGRVEYAHERESLAALERALLVELSKRNVIDTWKPPQKDRLRSLIRLAIVELYGGRRLTGEEKADALGIARQNWYKTWALRYDTVVLREVKARQLELDSLLKRF